MEEKINLEKNENAENTNAQPDPVVSETSAPGNVSADENTVPGASSNVSSDTNSNPEAEQSANPNYFEKPEQPPQNGFSAMSSQLMDRFRQGNQVRTLRKQIGERNEEKARAFHYIGMELYDLCKGDISKYPEFEPHLMRLLELDKEIARMQAEIDAIEAEKARAAQARQVQNRAPQYCTCGAVVPAGARYCTRCGKPLLIRASEDILCTCGATIKKDTSFCPRCGKRAAELLDEQTIAANYTQPQPYPIYGNPNAQ